MRQLNREAVTKVGILRRLRDANLEQLADPRSRRGRRYSQRSLVTSLALGCVSGLRSLRDVEALTAGMSPAARQATGIRRRYSDTKLRDTLLALQSQELREALHREVKAEKRRGNLAPARLPIGVVALDGKGLGKLDDWSHPDVQPVRPAGKAPYGLARVHRAHLVSAQATVCIDQRPIPGDTSELGAVCQFTKEMIQTYKRTGLFEVIVADAGNTSLEHAGVIDGHDLGYVLAIKGSSGDIYQEALRLLSELGPQDAEHGETCREKGASVTRRVWRVTVPGHLAWTHARQLVRVERIVQKGGQTVSQGNRYFVTNLVPGRLKATHWLSLVRLYWRCENEGHWTADVVWKEDARRTPWIRVPQAVYALSLLRLIALNVLAVLRRLSRRDYDSRAVTWRDVTLAARFAFAGPDIVLKEQLAFD